MNTFIFDMDGVLLDSEKILLDSISLYFQELEIGDTIPQELFCSLTGKKDEEIAEILIEKLHLNKNVEDCLRDQDRYYTKILKNNDVFVPMPGLVSFLEELKQRKFKIALAFSSGMNWIHEVIDRLNVRKYFDVIVSGDHVKVSKPAPDIFLKAAEQCNSSIEECIVIEDSHNGVQAGKNAGMYVIGYKASDIVQDTSNADIEVASFQEIPLDELCKKTFIDEG